MQKADSIIMLDPQGSTLNISISGVIGVPEMFQEGEDITTTKEKLSEQIKTFQDIDKSVKQINLFIDSPGGSVEHALSMYNALVQHPAKKTVTYTGTSASAATIIGAVATKENIQMSDVLTLLIHEARIPKLFEVETASTMERQATELRKINKIAAKIYSKVNGLSVEKNLAIMHQDRDWEQEV